MKTRAFDRESDGDQRSSEPADLPWPTTMRSARSPDGGDHAVGVVLELERVVVARQSGATISCPRLGSSASTRYQ
jgi:hypothetical protein